MSSKKKITHATTFAEIREIITHRESPEALGKEVAFYRQLGTFVSSFAHVEGQLPLVVARYAEMDPITAKAVLHALRIDSGSKMLRRLIEAKKLTGPHIDEIDAILTQLTHINTVRNDILHLGLSSEDLFESDKYIATNKMQAHSAKNIKTRTIDTETLTQLIADLTVMLAILSLHYVPHSGGDEMSQLLRGMREMHPLGKPIAWQYKPPEQSSQSPHRSNNRVRKRRP